ncbi:MAG TPA: right-handed parallel beta-helix repeat-containing protein [Ramlibacter sp.]|nr:right-handed parallel beta-helix repeat-containing protein [Ramlibacter sp.]
MQAAPLPLEARAPAPTVCVHTGGGDEYNVGGPGANPNREEEIIDIPWELLEAGDTVRIHWRAEPYRARIALFRSGTADQPIRVCGVPGPAGERPHITGDGAFTRAGPDFATGIPGALQTYGVMTISGRDFDSRVEHVIVEGLRIGDTKDGPGRVDVPEDDAPFTDASGTPRQYESAAACIRMRQAHHITLRNNEITNCGDGIFAGSVPDSENHIIRNLLVEGNHIHDNAIIGDESRHQAYLQGVDITVQFNYFGPVRTRPEGVASGNQLKMRAAGLVVRYNYLRNGARALDLVEAEEHIPYLAPWQYQRLRSQYLACQVEGCLKLTAAELAQYDARQRADWAKYQHAYVYGNLIHVVGRDDGATLLPSNLVHYGFDNSQHDRQPGTLWFFHNTVLWQTDRDALRVARLFDYGSDFGDAGYYDYDPDLLNFGGALHYITENNDDATCRQPAAGCTNWGPMLQRRVEHFGRMRAFHNALVRVPFTPGGAASDFELTRNRWDQLELLGPTWLSQGWDTDSDGDTLGGGFGQRRLPDSHVYQGGNDAHHVTGLAHVRSSGGVPIATDTMAPTAGSALRGAAGSWPSVLADVLRPGFSITVDPAQPGRVLVAPRVQWSTVGASE